MSRRSALADGTVRPVSPITADAPGGKPHWLSCAASEGTSGLPVDRVPEVVRAAVRRVRGVDYRYTAGAAGWTLAASLASDEPLPSFDQSAVDGYAFAATGDDAGARYRVTALARAGRAAGAIEPGEAALVMTGAPIPTGADRVAMQERCERNGGLVIPPAGLGPGANVRRRAEDIAPGDPLVAAGTALDARHVALLVAAGHERVPCVRTLRVAILATGDELRGDGAQDEPAPGSIRDSNTPMLRALLTAPDVAVHCERVRDDRLSIHERLGALAAGHDLIVTTGGMSFGIEDHVRAAVEGRGGHFMLRSLAMKPGKPVGLATLGGAVLLGLPGNPFAALVAFLIVGREVLAALRGRGAVPVLRPAVAAFALDRRPGRTEYFPVGIIGADAFGRPQLARLGKGGSARLAPLARADGMGRIEAPISRIDPGDALGFVDFRPGFAC